MKFDVDNFVTYLNKQTSNLFSHEKQKKQLLNDDVINDFKYTALERLEKFGKDILQYKSRDLTKFLSNLKEIFKHIIVSFKTDEQIKKEISDIIRLALIAELSVCINVINNLIIYATNNRMKTLFDCLKYYRLNLDKQKSLKDKGNKGTSGTNKNKRNIDKVNNVSLPKPKKNKKEVKEVKDILDYENNSDYESSDDESKQKLDGDDDDDDDDGDEDDDEDEDEDEGE